MHIDQIVDFASAGTAPEHYRPAAEKLLKGDPEQSVRNHYGSPCGQFNVGIWEGAVGQWTIHYTEHEYCEILQGVSVIRDEDGNAFVFDGIIGAVERNDAVAARVGVLAHQHPARAVAGGDQPLQRVPPGEVGEEAEDGGVTGCHAHQCGTDHQIGRASCRERV